MLQAGAAGSYADPQHGLTEAVQLSWPTGVACCSLVVSALVVVDVTFVVVSGVAAASAGGGVPVAARNRQPTATRGIP